MTAPLRAFVAYRVISRLYFYLLILFPYLWLEGLSLPVVAAALAAHGLAITFSESRLLGPVRAVSERQQMLLGEALKAIALGALVAWPTPTGAIAGQAVGGIGYALTAGPDTRFLRSLAPDGVTFDRIQSSTQSYMFLSLLFAGVAGALLFTIDSALPFLTTLAVTPFAVGALLLALQGIDQAAPKAPVPSVTVHEHPPIGRRAMFWVDYYALTRGVRLGTYLGLLPYLFFIELKVEVGYFGAIFGSFALLAFLAARWTIPLGKRVGLTRLTFATMVMMAVGLALLTEARSLPMSIAGMGLLGIATGGVRPLTLSNLFYEDLTAAQHKRALSIMEQRTGLLSAAVILLGGVLLGFHILTFGELMIITVVCYVAAVAALFSLRPGTSPGRRQPRPWEALDPPSPFHRLLLTPRVRGVTFNLRRPEPAPRRHLIAMVASRVASTSDVDQG